jgi:hypothetical protein
MSAKLKALKKNYKALNTAGDFFTDVRSETVTATELMGTISGFRGQIAEMRAEHDTLAHIRKRSNAAVAHAKANAQTLRSQLDRVESRTAVAKELKKQAEMTYGATKV